MANNKMIGRCEYCGQDYCQECSDHEEWEKYCSEECAKEAKKEEEENNE